MLVSYGSQKVEWKGKIEIEKGITIIKNPTESLYGEIKFELEEDLSIGNQQDENFMFYRGVDFFVDDNENIFVLDKGNCRIQKFDRNGNYLLTIGRKGQGPGEFEHPRRMYLDSKDNIYVLERPRMSIFDKNGEFRRSIPLGFYIGSFGITDEGNILAQTFSITSKGRTHDIILISENGKMLKKVVSFPFPIGARKKDTIIGTFNPFNPWLYYCSLNEKSGIYGYSSEYKLFIVNQIGENLSIIEKSETPEPISHKEKNTIIKNEIEMWRRQRKIKLSKSEVEKACKFSKHKPFYGGIIKDDKKNIYVLKLNSNLAEKKELNCDLFNRKGYYIYKVKIQAVVPRLIKNGYIYTSFSNPKTGYFKVKRYIIKNWNQIKEGI